MTYTNDKQELVILTAKGRRLCKRFDTLPDGEIDKNNISLGTYFAYCRESVGSLDDVFRVLQAYSASVEHCIIRGQVRDDVDSNRPIRRQLSRGRSTDPNEEAIEDQPCQWIMLDIDKLDLPEGYDVAQDPRRVHRICFIVAPSRVSIGIFYMAFIRLLRNHQYIKDFRAPFLLVNKAVG